MTGTRQAGRLDGAYDLQRLTLDDRNLGAVADLQELLVAIRRKRQVTCKRRIGLDDLIDELSLGREHLDSAALPIGDIHHAVVRHAEGVDDVETLWALPRRERFRRH